MKECFREFANQVGSSVKFTINKKIMDPISNMLIMMKNGGQAGKESVAFPYSKLKEAITNCLLKEGYIKNVFNPINPVIQ